MHYFGPQNRSAWETVRDSMGQFVTSSPTKLCHQVMTKHMEKHFEKKNDDLQVKLAKAETLTLALTNNKRKLTSHLPVTSSVLTGRCSPDAVCAKLSKTVRLHTGNLYFSVRAAFSETIHHKLSAAFMSNIVLA